MYGDRSEMSLGMFMLIAAVLVVGGWLLITGYQSCTGTSRQANALKYAHEYAAQLYPGEQATAVCQQVDTDSNGYLSCTLRVGQQVLAIECADNYTIETNKGCRPVRAVIQGVQQVGGNNNSGQ